MRAQSRDKQERGTERKKGEVALISMGLAGLTRIYFYRFTHYGMCALRSIPTIPHQEISKSMPKSPKHVLKHELITIVKKNRLRCMKART